MTNDDVSTICSSCGYVLPERSGWRRKQKNEPLTPAVDHREKYSFDADEKEVAEFKPSSSVARRMEIQSLAVGLFPAVFAVVIEDSSDPISFSLKFIGLAAVTFLLIWGFPGVFSHFFWKKFISRSEYVVTNKRVIINIARRKWKPFSVPLDRIAYLRIFHSRSIFSNVIIVTSPKKSGLRDNAMEPGPGAIPDSATLSISEQTVANSKKPGRARTTVRLIRSVRRSTLLYLSNEDALRAEETINRLLEPTGASPSS